MRRGRGRGGGGPWRGGGGGRGRGRGGGGGGGGAARGGCRVPARLSKGVMVAVAGRLVQAVVSRCRLPADGDILVPFGAPTIMGTTDPPATDPDDGVADNDGVEALRVAGD